jgi:hypothetical protein
MALKEAAALFFLFTLSLTPPASAGEASAVIFWIRADPAAEFPDSLVEGEGLSLGKIEPKPALCTAAAAADPALEEKVCEAVDLFYSNDFEASESILWDVWQEIGKGKDVLDIPPSLITRCFAFRMLMFKATGLGSEAEALALEAALSQGYAVDLALPAQEDCSLWIDGVRQPEAGERLEFAGGVHWVRASCGGAAGWTWRVEFPMHDGAALHLDPKAESRCACGDMPVVACQDPMARVPAMASNLMLHPGIESCFVLREDAGSGGFLLSGEITPAMESRDFQDLSWVRVGEHAALDMERDGEAFEAGAGKKFRLNVPALALAAAGIGMAGLSIGLGAGSAGASAEAYTQKDPWIRNAKQREASRLENAALAMAGVAVSLFVTSLIYHIVVYKRHKALKKKQTIN